LIINPIEEPRIKMTAHPSARTRRATTWRTPPLLPSTWPQLGPGLKGAKGIRPRPSLALWL